MVGNVTATGVGLRTVVASIALATGVWRSVTQSKARATLGPQLVCNSARHASSGAQKATKALQRVVLARVTILQDIPVVAMATKALQRVVLPRVTI